MNMVGKSAAVMPLTLEMLLVLLLATPAVTTGTGTPHATCKGRYLGCYKDSVPAPGVPPVRVINTILEKGPVATMTVDGCVSACAARGFLYAGITGEPKKFFCYCSCNLNPAAPPEPNNATYCPTQCSAGTPGSCGGDGAMAAYGPITCTPADPPSHTCGPPAPPLPPGPACSQPESRAFKFCNTSLSLKARVADLVHRISVGEAGALLTARESPAIPRLGIPSFYWGTNALHGVQWGNATSFPQTISLASTWNRSLWRGVGRVVGREMRALHNVGVPNVGLASWSPVLNIQRPRWGRNQESVSEDPLLAGEYGAQFSLGMQYDRHPSDSRPPPPAHAGGLLAVTTLKHVLAYSLDYYSIDGNMSRVTHRRSTFDARVSAYDLADTYARPFRRAIGRGGAAGVMYACNEVNGVPAVASADLAARLREWGFDGYRTTDGDGVGGLYAKNRQHYVSNATAAVAVALADGESDIDDGSNYQTHLADAYAAGAVSLATIRRALTNIFRIQFRLGLFDPAEGQKWRQLGMTDVDTLSSRRLNMEAARQSLVLLQNRGKTLPFTVSPTAGAPKVVVIGPSANSTRLLGGGHYARNLAIVDGFETGGFPGIPGAIQNVLGDDAASVTWLPGIKCTSRPDQVCVDPKPDAALKAAAVAAAEDATHVVLVLGLQSRAPCDTARAYHDGGNEFNPCGYEAEQHDRTRLTLPKVQQSLSTAVLAAAKARGVPAAVVLVHGGTLAVEGLKSDADAILDVHYPGEVTGAQAVADALWGRFSPAGKLTYSVMPAVYSNLSDFASMSMTDVPGRSYRYYPTSPDLPPPLWTFGAGLTYTNWRFSLASGVESAMSPPVVATLPASWTVRVTNTGKVDSDEVVQVFFVPLFTRPGCPTPHRQLIDFQRVHVKAGDTVPVTFSIAQLELVAVDGSKSQVPGNYTIVFTNGEDAMVNVTVNV